MFDAYFYWQNRQPNVRRSGDALDELHLMGLASVKRTGDNEEAVHAAVKQDARSDAQR
jgi:hypothetical protein